MHRHGVLHQFRAYLHQASESMLQQLCNDASDSVLIDNNGVTQKRIASPFLSDYIVTVRNEVAKVMFLHLSVILFTGGTTLAGTPPRTRYTPRAGTPPGITSPRQVHPQGRYIPGQVHPLGRYTPQAGTPPGRYTPQDQVHPPEPGTAPQAGTPLAGTPLADHVPPGSRDGYYCGRYASYWNAFLFSMRMVMLTSPQH